MSVSVLETSQRSNYHLVIKFTQIRAKKSSIDDEKDLASKIQFRY